MLRAISAVTNRPEKLLPPINSYGFRLTKYKRPQRSELGPVTREKHAAPHHVRDSTIKSGGPNRLCILTWIKERECDPAVGLCAAPLWQKGAVVQ